MEDSGGEKNQNLRYNIEETNHGVTNGNEETVEVAMTVLKLRIDFDERLAWMICDSLFL